MMKLITLLLATILLSGMTINATHIDMRLRESTEDIIYTKVFPKVNQGKFYTGPLVKNVLSTLNFGLKETDMKLRRHHEDTILEFASTVAFDSFSLEQLAIPGFGKSDYIVKSNCGKGIGQGMRITLKVKYDSDKDEFEDPKDAFKFHCVGDRKKTPFKLALDRDQEVKGNWFNKLRGKVIAGVANIGMKGKDSFIIRKLKDLGLELLLGEINKEVQNPYAKDTLASLKKKGVTEAGPDSVSYILYQILQQEENIQIVTSGSPLKKRQGESKCLFEPAVTLENFKFKQMTVKLNSYYHQHKKQRGAHRIMFDFDGLETKIEHAYLPDFIGKRILGAFELNDERIATRKNYESQWVTRMDEGSVVNKWATSKLLNILLPPKKVPKEEDKGLWHSVHSTAGGIVNNVKGWLGW